LKLLLTKIREEDEATAPSFDHEVGDAVENDIKILKSHKIILVEGNYLLLDEKPWTDMNPLFDELWYIDCDIDVAMERVRRRHMKAFGMTSEQAVERIVTNDRPNAEHIARCKVKPNRIILFL